MISTGNSLNILPLNEMVTQLTLINTYLRVYVHANQCRDFNMIILLGKYKSKLVPLSRCLPVMDGVYYRSIK